MFLLRVKMNRPLEICVPKYCLEFLASQRPRKVAIRTMPFQHMHASESCDIKEIPTSIVSVEAFWVLAALLKIKRFAKNVTSMSVR